MTRIAGLLLCLVALPAIAQARKPHSTRAHKAKSHKQPAPELVAGGPHYRVMTAEGPIHVWLPPNYSRGRAGVVVYVHGLGDTADSAWSEHHLAEQFAASRQNAVFIVPEAPREGKEPVHFPSLHALLSTVWDKTRLRPPGGALVVVGHSGAYRTMAAWLEEKALIDLILIDALYGMEDEYRNWLVKGPGAGPKRMVLVARGTTKWTDPFVRSLKSMAVKDERIPDRASDFTKRERSARLLYLKSQYAHLELITSGKVLPVLLSRTRLRRI